MDSSRAEVCSGEVPCFEGRRAEGDSFSTCKGGEGSASDQKLLRRGIIAEEPQGAIEVAGLKAHVWHWTRDPRTAISKSTIFSANVLISLLKQKLYSPVTLAVNTESSCRSFEFSMMTFPSGPMTV